MPTLTLKSNNSRTTVVLIKDMGVSVPPSGGTEIFSDTEELSDAHGSQNLLALATDDFYGLDSSTLLIIHPVDGVLVTSKVEGYLSTFHIANSGPYGLVIRDSNGVAATSSMPPATMVGQFLYSVNGSVFAPELPIITELGYIVVDESDHLVVV